MLDLSLGSKLLAKDEPAPTRSLAPRPSTVAAVASRFDRGNGFQPDGMSDLERLAATPGAAESFAAFDAQQQDEGGLAALQRLAYSQPPEPPLDVMQQIAYGAPEDLAQELMADQRARDAARGYPSMSAGDPAYGDLPQFGEALPGVNRAIPSPLADPGSVWDTVIEGLTSPRRGLDTARSFDETFVQPTRNLTRGVVPGDSRFEDILSAFAGEATRPTSIAAMLVPPIKASRIANPLARIAANAAIQGGANVGADVAIGRADRDYWTSPTGFALSAGLGAGLGGLVPEAGAGMRGLRELAESPRVRATLASESGMAKIPGEKPPIEPGPGEAASSSLPADVLPAPQRLPDEAVAPEAAIPAEPPVRAAEGAGAPPEVPPTALAAEPPEPEGSLPEVFRTGKRPDTSRTLTDTGEPIDVGAEGGPMNYPGGQPVVQGVGEATAKKPPYIGGRDRIGDVLDRAEEQRIETFEARARELGAPPEVVKVLSAAYRDGQTFAAAARRYADSGPVMQMLAKGKAWAEGNVPDGVVNSIARAHLVGANGVRIYVDEQLPRFKGLDKLIDAAPLRFRGPAKFKALAEEFRGQAVVTHPEWWNGITPELRAKLADVKAFQDELYRVVQAIDKNAAPALDGAYLRTVWEIPESKLTSAVAMPIGRASVTKARAFPDPFEAMADGNWPYKLKATGVEELIASSAHLSGRQIGVQLERKMILDRFGTTHKMPGLMRFRNPNYAGWYAKPEIVNFIDQLHEPASSITRQAGNLTSLIRNMIFGVGDVGVFGQHVLNLMSTRGPIAVAGAINRGLEALGLGADLYRYADADLPRALQRTLDGMPAKGSQAGRVGDPHAKTPLGLIPKAGPKIDAGVDALNDFQFNGVLAPLRDMTYEGNLLVKKLLHGVTGADRFDITKPAVRRQAAENANAFSGASLGALRLARKQGEAAFLGAPSITRSMAAELAQVAKLNTPEAWTTLATIGAVVYGIGSAIQMQYGSGEPVTLDPRSVNWATVHVGGSWQMVNGEKKYVGGRKIRMIPQASLVRAIGKSMVAVEEGDPAKFTKAWTQFAFGRSTPLIQDAVTLPTGIGFTDEGYFSPNLPFNQRLKNVAPVPIAGRGLLKGETSPAELALSEFGASSFPGQSVEDVKKDQTGDANKRLDKSGYTAISEDVWKTLQADGDAPKGADTFGEFKSDWIDERTAKIRAENPEASLIDAQAVAERFFKRQYGELESAIDRIVSRKREKLRLDPKIAEDIVITGGSAGARQKELSGVR